MLGHLLPLPIRSAPPRGDRRAPAGGPPRSGRLVLGGALAVLLATLGSPSALADPAAVDEVPEHAYRVEGTEVSGGASLAQAPEITPGIVRDVLEEGATGDSAEGTAKYYRIGVADGQRVHAAATIAAPPYADGLPEERESLDVDVDLVTAQGADCVDGSTRTAGETFDGDGPITSARVSAEVGPDGCAGEALYLRVQRLGARDAERPLPVEIQVAIQPAGLGGGAPAVEEPIEDDGAAPVAPENTEPITPGRSFATATRLEPGSTVLELLPGESALLDIDVQEGQRLRWRTEVTALPSEGSPDIGLRVFDAVRGQVAVDGGMWTVHSSATISGGGMTAPVDLGNRSSETESIRSAWLPGTYTVQLQRRQLPEGAPAAEAEPVRLILTLEVEGEVAEDAAEGDVLQLGDASSESRRGPLGGDWTAGRIALLAGAGVLGVLGLGTGLAGVLVLIRRR